MQCHASRSWRLQTADQTADQDKLIEIFISGELAKTDSKYNKRAASLEVGKHKQKIK